MPDPPPGLIVAVMLALTSGCTPPVLWHARTPDRRREVAVLGGDGERIAVDGAAHARFDRVLVTELLLDAAGRGPAYVGERGREAFVVVGGAEHGPWDEIEDLTAGGAVIAFAARTGTSWQVHRLTSELPEPIGPALAALVPDTLRLDERGALAFVGLPLASTGPTDLERLYWAPPDGPHDPVRHASPAADAIRIVAATPRGFVAVLREAGHERLVRAEAELVELDAGWEEILEPVVRGDAFAFFGARPGDVVLVHGRPTHEAERVAEAPVLTHLRLSDDGLHTACLLPDDDGIALLYDGAPLATHRRIDGERLAFVPETGLVAWIAEDAQAPRLLLGDPSGRVESDRYGEIEGPTLAPRRVGFVGRDPIGRSGSEVVLVEAGEAPAIVARAEWAGSLRLGRAGHAFVVREAGARAVVTARGRWPIPRFFVDTLALDPRGEHWAAVVPDAAERELTVWIDGEPSVGLDLDEVSSLAVRADGTADAPSLLVDITRAELAARAGQ